ncbi:MAG: hypothetical protein AB1689_22055 [Thermodesulfobacteriota bacterium]
MHVPTDSSFITLDDGTVPLAIDPVQFEVLWHGFGELTPERQLLLAILERTAADLRNFRYARQHANQRLYMDAYLWVSSEDRSHPFAFENVCEFLKLSPEHLRANLLGRDLSREPMAAAA